MSNKRISDEDKSYNIIAVEKKANNHFNSPNSQEKTLIPLNITVASCPTISVVGRVVTRLFELDLLNHETQFGNFA